MINYFSMHFCIVIKLKVDLMAKFNINRFRCFNTQKAQSLSCWSFKLVTSCPFLCSLQTTEFSDRPRVVARCREIFPSKAHICFRKMAPFVKLLKCKSPLPSIGIAWRRTGLSCRRRQQAESQWLAVGEATAVLLACWTRYSLLSWDSCKPVAHSTAIRRLFL